MFLLKMSPRCAAIAASKLLASPCQPHKLRYGRARNASNAKSFPATGPRTATPAEFADPAGAVARVAQPRPTGNGNESGFGGAAQRSGRKAGTKVDFDRRAIQGGIRATGQAR